MKAIFKSAATMASSREGAFHDFYQGCIDGPSLRGLWGRSATGQNGQAAANKEVSAVWSEGRMSENISGVPAGRSVFHLTSPFIGLTEDRGLDKESQVLGKCG
jgi:hypothetical protein